MQGAREGTLDCVVERHKPYSRRRRPAVQNVLHEILVLAWELDSEIETITNVHMLPTFTCLSGPLNGMYESYPLSSAMA